MTRQSVFIAWISVAFMFLSTNLFAETKSFQEYLDTAKEAYDAENYEEAIRNLLLANSVENNARLLFNVAKSYQKLGECDKAIVYFTAFRRQSAADAELRGQALEEIKASKSCQTIDPLAGRFFIKSEPSGATVEIDGKVIGITPLESAGYQSGPHEITFSLEGYLSATQSVDTLPGNDQLVSHKLQVGDDELLPDDPIASSSSSNLVPMIIAGSLTTVGAGVLGFGLYTDLVTIADLKDEQGQVDTETKAGADQFNLIGDEIDSEINTAIASYIIGGTLMAGGVGYFAYILATGADDADSENEIVIAPSITSHGYGLQFSSSF